MRVILKPDLFAELDEAERKVWKRNVKPFNPKGHDPLWAQGRLGNYFHNIKCDKAEFLTPFIEHQIPLMVRKDTRPVWVRKENHEELVWLWVENETLDEFHINEEHYQRGLTWLLGGSNLGSVPARFVRNEVGMFPERSVLFTPCDEDVKPQVFHRKNKATTR